MDQPNQKYPTLNVKQANAAPVSDDPRFESQRATPINTKPQNANTIAASSRDVASFIASLIRFRQLERRPTGQTYPPLVSRRPDRIATKIQNSLTTNKPANVGSIFEKFLLGRRVLHKVRSLLGILVFPGDQP